MTSVIPLWPDGAPLPDPAGATEREWTPPPGSLFPFRQVRNVTEPSLTAFLPEAGAATGTAVVVCPGGGHHMLSMDHEGVDLANWLVRRGIAAYVLKYRLIPSSASDDEFEARFLQVLSEPELLPELLTDEHHARVLADGKRAVALVRELGLERVGILGFSAGGYVAASVGLHYDEGSRPDFVAAIYGAVWEELAVPADAPPLFLALATDDELGERIVGTSLRLYSAWVEAGRSAELHAYAAGGHGFGMNRQQLPVDGWVDRFYEWLIQQELGATNERSRS